MVRTNNSEDEIEVRDEGNSKVRTCCSLKIQTQMKNIESEDIIEINEHEIISAIESMKRVRAHGYDDIVTEMTDGLKEIVLPSI